MSTRERECPPNSRRRWLATTCVALALAALAVAGCGGSSSNTSKASKNVSFALPPSSPPTSIFPLLSSAQYTNVNLNQFTKLMFVPLYWIGHGSTVLTANATRSIGNPPVWSSDGRTVTITLKHWMWSNGTQVTARDVEFCFPVRPDHEREAWELHAAGQITRVHGLVILAPPGDVIGAQQQVQQLGELGEPVRPLPLSQCRATEHFGVEDIAAGARAQPEEEPAAADVVERGELPGEAHRVPEVRRRHQRAEADAGGHRRRRRQRRDRVEPRPVHQIAPAQVVVGPGVVEAVLLGLPPAP